MVRRESSMPAATRRDVATDQRDVGRLDGDVGTAADGEADVGGGQRRRVVDAVADHADLGAVRFAVCGSVPACRPAWRGRPPRSMPTSRAMWCAAASTSPVAMMVVRPRRWSRAMASRAPSRGPVGDGEQGHAAAIEGDEHRRLALLGPGVGLRPLGVDSRHVALLQQRGVADQHRARRRNWRRRRGPAGHGNRPSALALTPRARHQAVIARARKCSECRPRRRRRAARIKASSWPAPDQEVGDHRLPSVMVPVLSNTSVSSLAAVSSASPLRM